TATAARAADGGRSRGRGPLVLAGVLLLAVGIGIGLLVNKDSGSGGGSSATTVATTAASAQLSPTGLPDPSNFTCAGDKNGTPGPGHFRFITSGCENAASTIARFP